MWLKCILVLIAIAGSAQASHFRGSFITWVVNQTDYNYYPANNYASLVKVHVKYGASWRRSDGSSHCSNSSIANCQFFNHGSWSLYRVYGSGYPQSYYSTFSAGFYCEKFSVDTDFTIGSNKVTIYVPKSYTYRAVTSSCCWIYGLRSYSSSSWHVEAIISLQKTYNGRVYKINTPPQISHIPIIQHNLYSSNYRTQSYILPVYDPDNDLVKCRWAANFSEGGGIWNSRNGLVVLSSKCVLTMFSSPYSHYANYKGWQALAIMVEDFEYNNVSHSYEKRHSIPLQFTVHLHMGNGSVIYGKNDTHCTSPYQHHASIAPSPTRSLTPKTTGYPQMVSSVPTIPPVQALDGCQYYQVLSEADRASSYYDWSSYRCDRELYGWYRFMGSAGNRMQNTCPQTGSYRCGSYYQGWLQGSMPSQYEGAVPRTVCFSTYYNCYCSYTQSIYVKNCGFFYVYWLNSVPTCNLRYCGAKDKSASVSCSNNYMRIEFDRKYYNTSEYSSITLRDSSCRASIYYSTIVLGNVPGACGSVKRDTYSHIVFENEVIFTGKVIGGLVTRNLDQRIKFSCIFSKNAHVQTVSYQPISNVTGEEVGYGNFTFFFVMYTSYQYTRMHTYYPVSVKLRDRMYLEIYANNIDNNIVVLVDQCFSTPNMDRNHPSKYTFINNRCPTDNTVMFHSTSNSRQRFSLQAFKYLQNSTAVFLHCLVFLCHSTSTDYRCRHGCAGNNIHRGKRDIGEEREDAPSSTYMIDIQVKLREEEGGGDNGERDASSKSSVALVASLACIAVVAIAIVAGLAWKVRKLKKVEVVIPMEARYAGDVDTAHTGPEGQLEDPDGPADMVVMSKEKQLEMFKNK